MGRKKRKGGFFSRVARLFGKAVKWVGKAILFTARAAVWMVTHPITTAVLAAAPLFWGRAWLYKKAVQATAAVAGGWWTSLKSFFRRAGRGFIYGGPVLRG